MDTRFNIRKFALAVLVVSLWVHVSEVFRYFVIVMPEMRESLSMVPGVAPMDFGIFMVWGVWDTLLTAMIVFMYWLVIKAFGTGLRSVLIAGVASWLFFFVLFWVGMVNMGLATINLAAPALVLALFETLLASYIAASFYPDGAE